MSVVREINPVTGENFYALSTQALANGLIHPDNFYTNEHDAFVGQREMADFMLNAVARADASRTKGRRPHMLVDIEKEARAMLKECAEFGV